MPSRPSSRSASDRSPSGDAERVVPRRAASATEDPASAEPTARKRGRQKVAEPTPVPPEPAPAALPPEALYQREKARRHTRLDDGVMAEAKRLLEEATAQTGRKGGAAFTVGSARGARGRPRKPVKPKDEFDLEEFGPESAGGAAGEDE